MAHVVSGKAVVNIDSTWHVSSCSVILEGSANKTIAEVGHIAQSVENIDTTVEHTTSWMFGRRTLLWWLLLVVVLDLDWGLSHLWCSKRVSDLLLLCVLLFAFSLVSYSLVIVALSVKEELAFTSLHSHQAFNTLCADVATGAHAATRCETSIRHGVHIVLHWVGVGRVVLESCQVDMGSCWLSNLLDQWIKVFLVERSVVVRNDFVNAATSCVVG